MEIHRNGQPEQERLRRDNNHLNRRQQRDSLRPFPPCRRERQSMAAGSAHPKVSSRVLKNPDSAGGQRKTALFFVSGLLESLFGCVRVCVFLLLTRPTSVSLATQCVPQRASLITKARGVLPDFTRGRHSSSSDDEGGGFLFLRGRAGEGEGVGARRFLSFLWCLGFFTRSSFFPLLSLSPASLACSRRASRWRLCLVRTAASPASSQL